MSSLSTSTKLSLMLISLAILIAATTTYFAQYLPPAATFIAGLLILTLAAILTIATTLARLATALAAIIQNPTAAKTPEISGAGDLARSLATIKSALAERAQLQAQAADFPRQLQAKTDAMEAELNHVSEVRKKAILGVAIAHKALADGNLGARWTEQVPDTHKSLQKDLNAAFEILEAAMHAVKATASSVQSGAGELKNASDDLARRTENQAATLEQTAASIAQLTASIKTTTDQIAQAQSIAATARNDAGQSTQILQSTTLAMTEIEKSSRNIGAIIGVIDEIAFQTNLLALNAGVEAARAGDAGRGFAVIATEVRALAQRSADASKEIKQLISVSGAQVETGVKMVEQTGGALTRIAAHVAQLNALMHSIAAVTQDQANGLTEVNKSVNHLDGVTQQNAAMAEQSNAISHTLYEDAQDLSGLIAKFQLSSGPHPATPSSPAQALPASLIPSFSPLPPATPHQKIPISTPRGAFKPRPI